MFTRALLGATLAASVAAQSRVLFFTKVDNPVTDGEPTAILYSTNDTESPVTITLRKGYASDLQTIDVLTDNNYGSEYIWTPPLYLPNGNDYALQIEQGEGDARQINYFGPFTVQGASPSAVRSYSASAASASQANATMTTASSGYSTTMLRNQTMHNATMTAHNTSTTSTATTTTAGTTTGAGFQGTQTGGNPRETGGASYVSTTGSSLALALGGIAAIVFLG